MRITIATALMMLLAAPAAHAAQWSTSYGRMNLPDSPVAGEIRADYSSDEGRIIGRILIPKCPDCGVMLEGVWVEAGSAKECDSPNDGSNHWGGVRLEFDPDYTAFAGEWDYCGSGRTYSWRGVLGSTRMPVLGDR